MFRYWFFHITEALVIYDLDNNICGHMIISFMTITKFSNLIGYQRP